MYFNLEIIYWGIDYLPFRAAIHYYFMSDLMARHELYNLLLLHPPPVSTSDHKLSTSWLNLNCKFCDFKSRL